MTLEVFRRLGCNTTLLPNYDKTHKNPEEYDPFEGVIIVRWSTLHHITKVALLS